MVDVFNPAALPALADNNLYELDPTPPNKPPTRFSNNYYKESVVLEPETVTNVFCPGPASVT